MRTQQQPEIKLRVPMLGMRQMMQLDNEASSSAHKLEIYMRTYS